MVCWIWERSLTGLFAVLLLAGVIFALVRLAGQPRVAVAKDASTITWWRWFRKRKVPFTEVACVELLVERKKYAWSTHLVDLDRSKVDEWKAILRLILRGGDCLYLGKVSGKYPQRRVLPLAEGMAEAIGVPVNEVGIIRI